VRLALVAGALVALLGAGLAYAKLGKLTPKDCVEDDDTVTAGCAQTEQGLEGLTDVAVSPDGESVYAVSGAPSNPENAIVRFDRNTGNGALTPQGCIDDNDIGLDGCGGDTDGLDGAFSLAVSPDGNSVYVVSLDDSAIVRFKRKGSGELIPKGCIQDNDSGVDQCSEEADALNAAAGVAVSPDGLDVYVTSLGDAAVTHFDRDPDTGALTFVGCIDDTSGPETCTEDDPTDGLNGAGGITVSPDGASVYVASGTGSRAIVRSTRDLTDGTLKAKGCIDDPAGVDPCDDTTDGLDGAANVAVSPDGTSVYVTAAFSDTIVRFKRDVADGSLKPKGCIEDIDNASPVCADQAQGLSFASDVAISPDGESVYVSSHGDDASIDWFKRNLTNGALTLKDCVEDTGKANCDKDADGLSGARGIDLSADGTSLYVAGQSDDAVVRLKRDPGP